jgi:DNA-directed RNA polymerase specialized sigma24 family protein
MDAPTVAIVHGHEPLAVSHDRSPRLDCSKRARIDLRMSGFPATRHSIVRAMRSAEADDRRAAFDALVTAYWKPVFKYVRLKWHASHEDAADLTQGFFLRAFEKDFFAGFDSSRARFRTYLRTCLDGFVANSRKSDARLKRGGAVTLIPIDFGDAERELRNRAGSLIVDFDAYFHREWLRSLFSCAAGRLRDGCEARGRAHRFRIFQQYDLASDDSDRPTYAELARRLGLSPADVTNELAGARREFRRLVLEVLREQCASDEEFEAESRALTR